MVNLILFQNKNSKDKSKWFVFSTSRPKTKKTLEMVKKDFQDRKFLLVKNL